MYNTRTVHTVDKAVYLDKIFTYLPANAFINKGRCGIGGTTLELTNTNRSSIIVAPTVGNLKDKVKSHPDLFIVWDEVSSEMVEEELRKRSPAQKIMTTPEGTKKIIDGAFSIGMLDELYSEWFFLLDECHSFINEDYRKDILRPFDYFWLFKSKAIISATPYHFTDERFRILDYHEIQFTEKLGTVRLIESSSVPGTLNYVIKQGLQQSIRLHIFLNSVTEIKKAVERAGLTNLNIYCANDKDKENRRKLGDMWQYFVEQPDSNNFKPVNFYTSRYFEGWDMFDDNAVIVLVTDIYQPHTKVAVGMKLKQAAGRLRVTKTSMIPHEVIHITNHHNNLAAAKSLNEFTTEYHINANTLLDVHKYYLERCKQNGSKTTTDQRLEKFADFQYKTHVATINPMKLDQQINHAYSDEAYNHIDLIQQEWEQVNYNVIRDKSTYKLETNTAMKRKSKAQQLEEDYQSIITYRQTQGDTIKLTFGNTLEQDIKVTNPLAYEASKLLDLTTMKRLMYNVKAVQEAVIIASNASKEYKLYKLLSHGFKQGDRYTLENIVNKLQGFYNMLEIRDSKTGLVKIAAATHLANGGWFDVKPCKLMNNEGGYEHGLIIVRPKLSVRIAA